MRSTTLEPSRLTFVFYSSEHRGALFFTLQKLCAARCSEDGLTTHVGLMSIGVFVDMVSAAHDSTVHTKMHLVKLAPTFSVHLHYIFLVDVRSSWDQQQVCAMLRPFCLGVGKKSDARRIVCFCFFLKGLVVGLVYKEQFCIVFPNALCWASGWHVAITFHRGSLFCAWHPSCECRIFIVVGIVQCTYGTGHVSHIGIFIVVVSCVLSQLCSLHLNSIEPFK